MMVDSKGNPKPRRTIESTEPFYWEKLEHQYAGMAMQGLIIRDHNIDDIVSISDEIATALVEKMKEVK